MVVEQRGELRALPEGKGGRGDGGGEAGDARQARVKDLWGVEV